MAIETGRLIFEANSLNPKTIDERRRRKGLVGSRLGWLLVGYVAHDLVFMVRVVLNNNVEVNTR